MLKKIALFLFVLATLAQPLRAADAPKPAEHETVATEAGEKEHGLMEKDIASGVWTLIIFLILLAILYKGAWKNVLAGLKGREQRITNDIAEAEAARAKAEAALKEYNAQLAAAEARGREILAKATLEAQALADRIKVDADKAAKERVERAAREIEESKNQALREIYEQAATLSTSIAEKILKRNLNANDQRDLVAQSLEQVQAINRG
jgi:F-type H+-transporting ATPase subunit b